MTEDCCHLVGYIIKEDTRRDSNPLPFEKIEALVIENSRSAGRDFQYEFFPINCYHTIKIQCFGTLEQCSRIVKEIKIMLADAINNGWARCDWLMANSVYREFKP